MKYLKKFEAIARPLEDYKVMSCEKCGSDVMSDSYDDEYSDHMGEKYYKCDSCGELNKDIKALKLEKPNNDHKPSAYASAISDTQNTNKKNRINRFKEKYY